MLLFSSTGFVQKVAQISCTTPAAMKLHWEFGFVLRWEGTILGVFLNILKTQIPFFFPVCFGRMCLNFFNVHNKCASTAAFITALSLNSSFLAVSQVSWYCLQCIKAWVNRSSLHNLHLAVNTNQIEMTVVKIHSRKLHIDSCVNTGEGC